MTISTFQGDSVIIDVTVKEGGVAKDITGATVDGAIRSPDGTITTVSSTITDAVNGVVQVPVAKSITDVSGTWNVELRLDLGVESQVVYSEDVIATASITTPT